MPLGKITGYTVVEQQNILISTLFGLVFLFIGIFGFVFSRKMKSESLEEKVKDYGKNVEIDVTFIRHGEKSEKGRLTKRGKEQARKYGFGLRKKTAIKGYSSPFYRAIKTTENIINTAPHDKKLKTRIRQDLGYPNYSKKFMNRLVEKYEKGGDDLAFDWFSKTRKLGKKDLTSKEAAQNLAYMLKNYENMSKRLYSGSDVDLILGTHAYLPESLLKQLLGFKSIKNIGGILNYAEPVEFKIKRDDKGKSHIGLYLRGKDYKVNMKKLNQLAGSYEKNH